MPPEEQPPSGGDIMAEDTREKILAAAKDLFGKKGYDGTSTKALAEAAGVNEVTLFRTFGSKEGLYAAVFAELMGPVDPAVLQGMDGKDLVADLSLFASHVSQLIGSSYGFVSATICHIKSRPPLKEVIDARPRVLQAFLQEYLERLADRGMVEGSPAELSNTLVHGLFGALLHFHAMGGRNDLQTLEAWLATFVPVFARGICKD